MNSIFVIPAAQILVCPLIHFSAFCILARIVPRRTISPMSRKKGNTATKELFALVTLLTGVPLFYNVFVIRIVHPRPHSNRCSYYRTRRDQFFSRHVSKRRVLFYRNSIALFSFFALRDKFAILEPKSAKSSMGRRSEKVFEIRRNWIFSPYNCEETLLER